MREEEENDIFPGREWGTGQKESRTTVSDSGLEKPLSGKMISLTSVV